MLDLRTAAILAWLPREFATHYLSTIPRPQPNAAVAPTAAGANGRAALRNWLLAVVGPVQSARLFEKAEAAAERSLSLGRALGQVAVPIGAADYPSLLTTIYDPPPLLWIRGQVNSLALPAVAVVGSRAAAPGALEVARQLGSGLAAAGVAVVSGLARGVDAAAHRGAVADGCTIAVLGSGVDVIYPREHDSLATAIEERGALISELPPGTPPLKFHFPLRNRVISGLSLGVVIVEASDRSGSLITARCALDQGREVMAVPGSVAGGRNRGAHALIRDGAALVETASDVLAVLGLERVGAPHPVNGGDEPDPVLARMPVAEPVDLYQLVRASGMDVTELLRKLLELELAGRVIRQPGGTFVRPSRAVVR